MTNTGFRPWRPSAADIAAKNKARGFKPAEIDKRVLAENNKFAQLTLEAPRIPWEQFSTKLEWRQGEHFALIGPTGQGKTTMLMQLLPMHPYVAVFATKPRDSTMERLQASGYQRMERWHSLDPDHYPRRIVWPNAKRLDSREIQRRAFMDAFEKIYLEGGWTVAIDETWYFSQVLKMEPQIKLYLLQARALDISLLCASQRPAYIPVEIYDMSTHLMFWRDNDERNLDRISGINFRSASFIKSVVADLEMHQVLYVNTRTGRMVRTRIPASMAA